MDWAPPVGAFAHLRHLSLPQATALPPSFPVLPSLTHLTFVNIPRHLPDLSVTFPALEYLMIEEIYFDSRKALAELARALPASLPSFATLLPITADICAALPDGLQHLIVHDCKAPGLACISQRWFPTGPGGGLTARPSGLQSLTLLSFNLGRRSASDAGVDDRTAGLLESDKVAKMRERGYAVRAR